METTGTWEPADVPGEGAMDEEGKPLKPPLTPPGGNGKREGQALNDFLESISGVSRDLELTNRIERSASNCTFK